MKVDSGRKLDRDAHALRSRVWADTSACGEQLGQDELKGERKMLGRPTGRQDKAFLDGGEIVRSAGLKSQMSMMRADDQTWTRAKSWLRMRSEVVADAM